MNPEIARIGHAVEFGMMQSELWLGQIDRFGLAVVADCCRELELNGHDDASRLLKRYFEIQNESTD